MGRQRVEILNREADFALPEPFAAWFFAKGWTLRPHQGATLARAQAGLSSLLIAPTGGGKTMGGFLFSLIDLSSAARADKSRPHRLHTLYLSPLKALTTDVARNLMGPAAEMALNLRIETRTGDTPPAKRARQRAHPPDILLTTPEQVLLLLASPHAGAFLADLRCVIVDEIHALAPTKRGDLTALALARIFALAPEAVRIGLSATSPDPDNLARWLVGAGVSKPESVIVRGAPGAAPEISVLESQAPIPWSGHTGRHAIAEIYQAIKAARTSLVFVNTRAQAELTFQELWSVNDDNLPIALHHGSLDVAQRRKVEAAMAAGKLRCVVCTSTLDLGVDWGDVDLVIQLGAPKGCSRLVQRIGRANHRLDEPSRALLAPNNRFEVLECLAAKDAVLEGHLDGAAVRVGGLDCLIQHMVTLACGDGFDADDLYEEIINTVPYEDLRRDTFDRALNVAATGGYSLRVYDRYRRIVQDVKTGRWRVRNSEIAAHHRMNVGAIIESAMLNVRLGARPPGRPLGQIEEYFIETLVPGDTFLFGGEILRLASVAEMDAFVVRAKGAEAPKIPSYNGGKFPLSTFLAARVRRLIHNPRLWKGLPAQVVEWLRFQKLRSIIPKPDEMLVETFPRADKFYLVCYPFEGRLAHQTLGMLLTRRLERLGFEPLGFAASEYALSVWGRQNMAGMDFAALFHADMLGDDLDAWLAESALMKRTFRDCALICGLIEKRSGGNKKTGRQVTFSTDLIYDVLRAHEPDHLLLQAAFADAGQGLLDITRLSDLLNRVQGKIVHRDLARVSPFAAPVMLEVGRVPVAGASEDAILREVAEDLIAEAMS